MKKSLLIAGSALLAVALPAIAATQASPRPDAPMMKDIKRADVTTKVKEQFAKFDTNKDGSITREEIAAQRDAMRKEMQAKRFAELDKDGNGSISRAEFDAGHAGRMAERGPRGPMGADGAPPPPPGAMADAGHDAKRQGHGRHNRMRGGMIEHGAMGLLRADANKDGSVTIAEATTAALARFDKADADKNGILTAQERRDAMKQMREQRGDRRGPGQDRPTPAAG